MALAYNSLAGEKMAFTINDFADLRRLLSERPEWRAELRELILTDELVELPRAFADSRVEYNARFERIENALEKLTERVDRLTERMDQLTERVDQLAFFMQELASQQKFFNDRQGEMLGKLLERDYADHAHAYFGDYLRRIHVVIPGRLDHAFEDALFEFLSQPQRRDVLHLDLLLRGQLISPPTPDVGTIYCAAEISAMIDRNDVERVMRRTALLRRAGLRVVPFVAGKGVTPGATELLDDAPVVLLMNGHGDGWERALDTALQALE